MLHTLQDFRKESYHCCAKSEMQCSRAGQERDVDIDQVNSLEAFDNLSDQLMADQELWTRMVNIFYIYEDPKWVLSRS